MGIMELCENMDSEEHNLRIGKFPNRKQKALNIKVK